MDNDPEMAGRAVEQWEVGDEPTVSPDAEVVATAPEQIGWRALRRERWVRWAFTAVLALFLLASVLGILGVRTTHTSASGGGYDVEVAYAAVTRPGMATPFEIEIRPSDGAPFDGSVRVAVSSRYLAMFDENGVSPDASSATATAEAQIWEFDPPANGEALVISFDARIEPGVQWGHDGFVQVLDEETPVVEATFHTWVAP